MYSLIIIPEQSFSSKTWAKVMVGFYEKKCIDKKIAKGKGSNRILRLSVDKMLL